MRLALAVCLTLGSALAQTVSLTVTTGMATGLVDEKIYGQTVSGAIWGEAVRNRSFEAASTEGSWDVRQGVLECAGPDGRFDFGGETWGGYELGVDVMRPAGTGALRVGAARLDRELENGRWYRVRVRREGSKVQAWLEDRPVQVSGEGGVFVGTEGGAGNFAHLKVMSLEGQPLLPGIPVAARQWYAAGAVEAALDGSRPMNGARSLRLTAGEGEGGVEQDGFAARPGDVLRGSLWMRGVAAGATVRLVDGAKVLASQELAAPAEQWREFSVALTPAAAARDATLQILVRGPAVVSLDQVSLMPDSARTTGGFRPDLLQAISGLRPPMIRWSAGYNWKDGIGPQAKRADSLAFGIDEAEALARKLGAGLVVAMPVGPHMRDAADFAGYCNGAAESEWGARRAANGHAAPYRVKYWEIDNEAAGMGAADYVEALRALVPAMKKADPSIKIIAGGGGSDLAVIRGAAELVDYLSARRDADPDKFAEAPGDAERFFKGLSAEIAGSKNPRMKLFLSEWNARGADWSTGLYTAGMLNVMERSGAVAMAAPAWLPEIGAPDYLVRKLYRDHFASDVLQMSGATSGLDAIVTKTPDDRRIYVKVVNPGSNAAAVAVTLRGDFPLLAADLQLVAGANPAAGNARAETAAIERAGMSVRFTVPRWSVAVVTLSR